MRRALVLAALGLAALLFAVSAKAAGPTIGWHEVKAGETLEGITARYLGSPAEWRENWKLNPTLRDPNRLTPGMRLRVIVARAVPARHAQVWQVARRVDRQPTPEPWTPATVGDRLRARDGLRTLEHSSAGLRFDDGATLVLTENSLVFVREPAPARTAVARDSIEIVEGQADVETRRTTKRSAEIEVVVAGAAVRPSETKSSTRARAASKTAQFMVYEGNAAVEAGGSTLVVPGGMGTNVPEGSAPGPLEKLLPAPMVLAPLASSSRVGPQAFRWSAVEGAQRYAIEICRDSGCASLVARGTTVPASWSPRALPPGELFWRVRGVAESGLDGFASQPVPFTNRIAVSGSILNEGSGAAFAGARVVAYREGGTVEAEGATDEGGRYALPVGAAGTYWIAVDSRTLRAGTWPEQTAAPAGGSCLGIELRAPRPCIGGRRAGVSDDARTLETSEHVARVSTTEDGLERIDFRFRLDVVSNTGDEGQGSLRQFILNANAVPGHDILRFVPAEPRSDTVWTIVAKTPLPELTDGATIDGTVRGHEGEIVSAPHRSINAAVEVGEAGRLLIPTDQAELELLAPALPYAIRARRPLVLRHIAISGADTNVETHDELTMENAIVGARADGSPAEVAGGTGIALHAGALGTMHRVYVAGQSEHGVRVDRAQLLADHVEVARCRNGMALHASASAVRFSLVSDIDIRPGNGVAWGNVVEQCTLGSELAASNGNRIAGNVVKRRAQ